MSVLNIPFKKIIKSSPFGPILRSAYQAFSHSRYRILDQFFLQADFAKLKMVPELSWMPDARHRIGGQSGYADWCHTIGVFKTAIYTHLENKTDNIILDIGCGTGKLFMASEPFLGSKGKYIGIEIEREKADFCRNHYPGDRSEFYFLDVSNPFYTENDTQKKMLEYPIDSNSVDCVLALSVWTHLDEANAAFYFKEINRVLKPGGCALLTFFLIDDQYDKSLPGLRANEFNRYTGSGTSRWVFDKKIQGSKHWFYPSAVQVPEAQIGVSTQGVSSLLNATQMKWQCSYPGTWKNAPGLYLQDILVFTNEN